MSNVFVVMGVGTFFMTWSAKNATGPRLGSNLASTFVRTGTLARLPWDAVSECPSLSSIFLDALPNMFNDGNLQRMGMQLCVNVGRSDRSDAWM